jgi:hypothetical protein
MPQSSLPPVAPAPAIANPLARRDFLSGLGGAGGERDRRVFGGAGAAMGLR